MSEEQKNSEIVESETELQAAEVTPVEPKTTGGWGRLLLTVLVLLALAAGLGGGWLGYQTQLQLDSIAPANK